MKVLLFFWIILYALEETTYNPVVLESLIQCHGIAWKF